MTHYSYEYESEEEVSKEVRASPKFVIVGPVGSGKTSLLTRYIKDSFNDDQKKTLGIDLQFKKTRNDKFQYTLWDTSGDPTYRQIATTYYSDASIFLLCFDLSDKESFDELENFAALINEHRNDLAKVLLVGTKSDLEQTVEQKAIKKFAEDNSFEYFATSAKEEKGVAKLFNRAIEVIKENSNGSKKTKVEEEDDESAESTVSEEGNKKVKKENTAGTGAVSSDDDESSESEEGHTAKRRIFGKSAFYRMQLHVEKLSKLKPEKGVKNDNVAGKNKANYLEDIFGDDEKPNLEQLQDMLENNPEGILNNRSKWGAGFFKFESRLLGKRNERLGDRLCESKTERLLVECIDELKFE